MESSIQPDPAPVEIIQIKTGTGAAAERIPVFAIDDTVYTMPAKVPGGLSLQLVEMMTEIGELAAVIWVFRKLLGDEAYEALRDSEDVSQEQMETIINTVSDRVLGGLEGKGSASGQGNSPGYSPMSGTSGRTSGPATGSRRKKR